MFFKKKEETVGLQRVDFIDCKPFSQLNEQLDYAKERLVIENESYLIRMRIYKDYLFKVVLVSDFSSFELSKTSNKTLKDSNLLSEDEAKLTKSMNVYVIRENTLRTREFAKENTILTKNGYQLILIYNSKECVLDHYSPLPKFNFSLMGYLRTILYFDLACHDKENY